jgi:hypothetical protein
VNNEDQDYVMNGTIDVVSQQDPNANNISNTGVRGNADTAGVLMVPAEDLDTYVQDLKSNGFAVDSAQDFSDIRAGDQQALLVWTTSGIDLGQVISTLQRITPNLPYRQRPADLNCVYVLGHSVPTFVDERGLSGISRNSCLCCH